MAWWLRSLHCRLTARRSWVGFQHGPLLVQGAGPPQTFSVQVGYVSPGPFCVEVACSPRVHKDPNITLSYQSLTKKDGSLHLVRGRLKAAHCSWGPGGRTIRDGEMQKSNSRRPQCVCVLCRHLIYARVHHCATIN